MKKIISAGIVLLCAGVTIATFIIFSAMTDPIPPQVRAGWYLPGQDIVWTTSGTDFESPGHEHFIYAGHHDASTPQFPALPNTVVMKITHISLQTTSI